MLWVGVRSREIHPSSASDSLCIHRLQCSSSDPQNQVSVKCPYKAGESPVRPSIVLSNICFSWYLSDSSTLSSVLCRMVSRSLYPQAGRGPVFAHRTCPCLSLGCHRTGAVGDTGSLRLALTQHAASEARF